NLDAVLMQQLNSTGNRSRTNTFTELELLVTDIEDAVSEMAAEMQMSAADSNEDEVSEHQAPGRVVPTHDAEY
ncbi:unnamed protein product, partial [Symbiodinium microadriaticum]